MLRRWIASTFVVVGLAIPLVAPGPATAGSQPQATVTEFQLPHAGSRPYTIVTGPDGNLWFTESDRGTIGRITPSGTITEFPLEEQESGPYGITVGADGNLWFTERYANQIGKITTSGTITEYPVPTPNAQPWDITALPNGDLWFTEETVDQVAVIHPNGVIDEYPSGLGQFPTFIATGPDGNIWFTEEIGNNIVRLDPANPENQTDFPLLTEQELPWDIQVGPDGNLWFTDACRPAHRQDHDGRCDHGVPGRREPRDRRDRRRSLRGHAVVHRERLVRRRPDRCQRQCRRRAALHERLSVRDHGRA